MMDLIILILGDVGANDLTPTSFHFSSHPILTHLPSKLDSNQGPVYACLEKGIELCMKRRQKPYYVRDEMCITRCFLICLHKFRKLKDQVHKKAYERFDVCDKHKNHLAREASIQDWYYNHIKDKFWKYWLLRHYYTQNKRWVNTLSLSLYVYFWNNIWFASHTKPKLWKAKRIYVYKTR